MDGFFDQRVGGWIGVNAFLTISYTNQQVDNLRFNNKVNLKKSFKVQTTNNW